MDRSVWLSLWARLTVQRCLAPRCMCPQGLLFVWGRRPRVHYELRITDGNRFPGGAPTEGDAVKFAAATLAELGLDRLRVVYRQPVEVPRA